MNFMFWRLINLIGYVENNINTIDFYYLYKLDVL